MTLATAFVGAVMLVGFGILVIGILFAILAVPFLIAEVVGELWASAFILISLLAFLTWLFYSSAP